MVDGNKVIGYIDNMNYSMIDTSLYNIMDLENYELSNLDSSNIYTFEYIELSSVTIEISGNIEDISMNSVIYKDKSINNLLGYINDISNTNKIVGISMNNIDLFVIKDSKLYIK